MFINTINGKLDHCQARSEVDIVPGGAAFVCDTNSSHLRLRLLYVGKQINGLNGDARVK